MAMHTVKAGDTLTKLAQQYGTSVQRLAELNGLDLNKNFLLPAKLNVPEKAANRSSFRSAPAQGAAAASGGGGASGVGAKVLESAQAQIGASQDCTALVERALRAAGKSDVGDESPQSLKRFGRQVDLSKEQPQPGDIIYYDDAGAGVPHVAIYAGNGMAVHGGWNGNTTSLQPVNVGSGPASYHRP